MAPPPESGPAANDPLRTLPFSEKTEHMNYLPRENRYLPAGTKVRLSSQQPEALEHGIVLHCWDDEEIRAWDCYVGFFGSSFPEAKPSVKPYVLRFAATSLEVLDSQSVLPGFCFRQSGQANPSFFCAPSAIF